MSKPPKKYIFKSYPLAYNLILRIMSIYQLIARYYENNSILGHTIKEIFQSQFRYSGPQQTCYRKRFYVAHTNRSHLYSYRNTIMKTAKALELLKKVRPYIGQGNLMMTDAVFVTPAQSLRNQADKIEYKEALLKEVDEFIALNK